MNSIFKNLFILYLVLGLNVVYAQNLDWAKQMGGTLNEFGQSIYVDSRGNVYTTGYFRGRGDFDPGTGTRNLTSAGHNDIFVQKLNSNGDLLWVNHMGGSGDDQGTSLGIDASGNVYVVGRFVGTVDFDPGTGISNLTSAGVGDIFIQKLDSSGKFLWVKQMGAAYFDYGIYVKLDVSGNLYITGSFQGKVDFDPGAGIHQLISAGGHDIFIQKLDAAGNFLWAKRMGGGRNDYGRSIGIDPFGSVYTLGYFSDTVDFDPGVGISSFTSAGNWDIFVQKLDSSGNFLWARQMGGIGYDVGNSIHVDSSGNAYFTGYFDDTVDFDPGVGIRNLKSAGNWDIFVQKLNSAGNFSWAKQMGGTGYDIGYSLGADVSGNLYVTGRFMGAADFDPGMGTSNLVSAGNSDVFIQKLDSSGNYLWVRGMGASGIDGAYSICIDNAGSIYTTGSFQDTVDFDPTVKKRNLTSVGGHDFFVQKLDPCIPNAAKDMVIACDSFKWIDGHTYRSSNNTATDTITNIAGCDSVVRLDLTINYSSTSTDFVTACDSFTWIDGITYKSSNRTAKDTLTNLAGCDSVVTLDLTVNYSSTRTDLIVACDSFTWIDGLTYTKSNNTAMYALTNAAGCDSVIGLDLTINYSGTSTDFVTACDSFTWIDGLTYTTSNNTAIYTLTNATGCDSTVTLDLGMSYSNTGKDIVVACDSFTWIDGFTYSTSNSNATHILTNAAGCDSVITLMLTINSVSDISTTKKKATITANNGRATYQWLNCMNNYGIIANETGMSFTAMRNGSYAVELTENGCVDTSDCTSITEVGVNELGEDITVITYPNPTNDLITIKFNRPVTNVELIVTDGQGKLIRETKHQSVLESQIKLGDHPGVYFLKIRTATGQKIIRLIRF